MDKYTKPGMEKNNNALFVGVLIAVLVIIITLALFTFWRKRKSAAQSILLMGLSDSGKTLIYARLLHSKFVETYTSAKENLGYILVGNNYLRIVDTPGNERLRNKYFDKYKSSAKAVIYVIDSVTIQRNVKDVTEYLYDLLSDLDIVRRNVPVLILCNKQDQCLAKGCSLIKVLLEEEINILRMTKISQLEGIDASLTNVFLGRRGSDFDFSQLDPQVYFAESCAFHENPEVPINMEELKNWLDRLDT